MTVAGIRSLILLRAADGGADRRWRRQPDRGGDDARAGRAGSGVPWGSTAGSPTAAGRNRHDAVGWPRRGLRAAGPGWRVAVAVAPAQVGPSVRPGSADDPRVTGGLHFLHRTAPVINC